MAWNPFGVMFELSATGSNVKRISATKFTVTIKASWESYYSGAVTNYGMTASSGGGSANLNTFGNYAERGSGSFTGTYSISGNGSATKSIAVKFRNYNNDNGDSATTTVTFNVTVPAWVSYTITYNANGGTGAPNSQTKWKDQSLVLSSTKPVKKGYTFKGWSLTQNGSKYYDAGGTCGKNENLTLWAVWQENALTVNYYSNYATSSFSGALNAVGSDKNVIVKTSEYLYDNDYSTYGLGNYSSSSGSIYLKRTGYNPTGYWGTTPSGGTLINEDDISFTSGQKLAQAFGKNLENGNATINVYAQWQLKTYTITYNKNSQTDSVDNMPSNQTKNHFTSIKLSENVPTRTNHNFFGWSTSPVGGAIYQPGSTYSAESNVTLYAVWELSASQITVYDEEGNPHNGTCFFYDDTGALHYAIITIYDEDGNPHSVI